MKYLLLNRGFKNLKTIDNYWKDESIEKGYDCEICGNPCSCSAEIYELKTKKSMD